MSVQLSLLDLPPRPRVVASAPLVSATHLLWEAAGRPTNTTDLTGRVDAVQVPGGARCWWCGHTCPDGWSRPRSILPDTFPFPLAASVPESPWICLPCGWTLCDRTALPADIGKARIEARAKKGGRLIVSVRGAPAVRWLVLELADGRVGLWRPSAATVRDEEPWMAAVDALRVEPADVDPCPFVEAVPYGDLAPEATEKFRSFHHLACAGRWWPCTDTDRRAIKDWLLSPPPPPWVCVIGEGKKHHAIAAQMADCVTTSNDFCVVWHRGSVVTYVPADLADLIASIEALIRAGASDEEIERGAYAPRSLELLVAIRAHEPVVEPYRGGPTLPLALYLRRNRKELAECP